MRASQEYMALVGDGWHGVCNAGACAGTLYMRVAGVGVYIPLAVLSCIRALRIDETV